MSPGSTSPRLVLTSPAQDWPLLTEICSPASEMTALVRLRSSSTVLSLLLSNLHQQRSDHYRVIVSPHGQRHGGVDEGEGWRLKEGHPDVPSVGGQPLQLRGLQAASGHEEWYQKYSNLMSPMLPVTQPRPPDNVQFANVGHLLQVLVVLVSTGLEAEQVLPAVTRLTTC